MNASLGDRLDIAMTAVLRAGTSRPEGWLIDQILEPPVPAAAVPRTDRPARRPRRLSKEAAERMAADAQEYDGQIVGGRLR